MLRRLQRDANLNGFAAYNLGIALLDEGHEHEALEQLETAGQGSGGDDPVLAIRDKSNLVLGPLLVDSGRSDAGAILRPRSSRRAVLELRVAGLGLGRGVGRKFRESRGSVGPVGGA